ncbi:MAG: hypothetical protein IIB36_11080 [Gemmatimonadetes bacterium]|nr:hypothetical protein [Gemmatimonadota bacterium]
MDARLQFFTLAREAVSGLPGLGATEPTNVLPRAGIGARRSIEIEGVEQPVGRAARMAELSNYWGGEAFSEVETRSLRDFIADHPTIGLFVDFHTGSGGFVQGVTGCWTPDDPVEDVMAVLKEHAPFVLKPFLPDEIPPISGMSTDYVSVRRRRRARQRGRGGSVNSNAHSRWVERPANPR